MDGPNFLNDVAVALVLALAGGLAARRLHLSPIVGYLLAGLMVGPFTPGYRADVETLHRLADVGVIFLMFGVGLHFDLRELAAARRVALPAGVAQVLLVSIAGWGVGVAIGLPPSEAAVFGMAASISSTVVLVRALEERGLSTAVAGRVLVGWLIVQDLLTIAMLVLLPVFAGGAEGATAAAAGTALRAIVFTAAVLASGSRVIPPLLRIVGRTGSRELFVLVMVCLSIGIAAGAQLAGASLALGAFIAGVAVSETEASHQAASDVLPLRDAFAVLFFVSVGMLLDPRSLVAHPVLWMAAVAGVVVAKAAVSGALAAAFPVPARTAFLAAAGLAQAGEFSFVIMEAGRALGIVGPAAYQAILGASALSIALNPLAFRAAAVAETWARQRRRLWMSLDRQGPTPDLPSPPARHVVIAGAGRVGLLAGRALASLGVPHVFVESSLEQVLVLQRQGRAAYWGDAASGDVLRAAGIGNARLLILAVPDAGSGSIAARRAREMNPDLAVVARAHSAADLETLRRASADAVVVPEFEGAVTIIRESLTYLDMSVEEIARVSGMIRAAEYAGD